MVSDRVRDFIWIKKGGELMTRNRRLRFLFARRILLGLALLAWMPASHAWLTTYHVGFLLGDSSQEVSESDVTSALGDAGFSDNRLDFDENSKITKLYGGFFFTQNFGIQLEYINLGGVDVDARGFPDAEKQKQEYADVLAKAMPSFGGGVALSMVGRFPIWGDFVIQDWVGVFGWKNEIEVNQVTGTDEGVDLALGVSLEYLLTDSLSARIEWERFNHNGDGINILGAGMTLYFGG